MIELEEQKIREDQKNLLIAMSVDCSLAVLSGMRGRGDGDAASCADGTRNRWTSFSSNEHLWLEEPGTGRRGGHHVKVKAARLGDGVMMADRYRSVGIGNIKGCVQK